MKRAKEFLNEFKSIFISNDLLKENEEHANIVTASTMLIVSIIGIMAWVLTYFNLFKIGVPLMNTLLISVFTFLTIPALICFAYRGKGSWIKHLLFVCFTILLAMADAMLKYNVTLIVVIPMIMAARYYNKSFTKIIAMITVGLFVVSIFMSVNIGQQDLNSYNLIIPKGTTITIEDTLRDAVIQIDVNQTERLKNIFIHFFLPKMMVFIIIYFACLQIAQSGKKMIEKQKEEMLQKEERIESELVSARSIQMNMLPSVFPPFPERKEIELYAQTTLAKEVGGDFYDMFLVDDDHLALCMADVSGKGIPAALFMMTVKNLIKNISELENELDSAFTRINNMLCEGNEAGLFVTCWFGILDLRNGKMEFINAGHNPPLLYSNKTGKFEYLRTRPDLVLAGMENTLYRKMEIQIEPGDRLFLYTDGVVEATDIDKKLYGEQRLKEFLDNHTKFDSEKTIKELKKDIGRFVGNVEQFDDITMLELIYKCKKDVKSVGVHKEFKAIESELLNVQSFVRNILIKNRFEPKVIRQIDLIVEEIFINIAKYAYQNEKGSCNLIVANEQNKKVTLTFEDHGVKFNPLEVKEPDVTLPASERKVGGLGIYITRKIMDSVDYKYENNKNILTITKII